MSAIRELEATLAEAERAYVEACQRRDAAVEGVRLAALAVAMLRSAMVEAMDELDRRDLLAWTQDGGNQTLKPHGSEDA